MSLLNPRLVYKPFEYPKAYEFWELQQQAHWLHSEIQMESDINDWKIKLNESDKHLIGSILKGFTQSEIFIEDYWSSKVAKWFPKPEIQMMAHTFASFETIHIASYSLLNDSLGFEDYTEFLSHKPTKDKIDRLINQSGDNLEDMALSLAIFSAFNEGVNLFSSFAILMNFSRFNLLKGTSQIVAFSVRDESLHSNAGCWLFNQLVKENPFLLTGSFVQQIYKSAELTFELENTFIDEAFSLGNPQGLEKKDLKDFIKYRINSKLKQIGFEAIYKVDKKTIEKFDWFEVLTSGVEHADFFATRVSTYSKGNKDWSKIWK